MEIKVPFLTSNEDEVLVVEILIANKQLVKKNQKLFSLETTKTSYDVLSEGDGFVLFNFETQDYIKSGHLMYEIFEVKKDLEEKIIKSNNKILDRIITDDAKKIITEKNINLDLIKDKIITKETLEKFLKNNKSISIPSGNPNSAVIVGASSHGKTVYDFLIENGKYKPIGFVNYDNNFIHDEKIFDLNIFGLNDLEKIYKEGTKYIYINTDNFNLTKKISSDAKKIGYKLINIIHKTACVSSTATIGECVFVGPFSIIGTGAKIGSFTKILNKASVAHDSIVGNYVQISDGATIAGNANIGDNSVIGINSAIINKCNVGKRVIVVSGKTVTNDLDDNIVFK